MNILLIKLTKDSFTEKIYTSKEGEESLKKDYELACKNGWTLFGSIFNPDFLIYILKEVHEN